MRRVNDILEERRRKNKEDLEKRQDEVFSKVPRLQEIRQEIKQKNILRINQSIQGKNVDKITDDITNLEDEYGKLLRGNGYTEDYLQMQYHCDICKDTGVDGSHICTCKKQLLIYEMYENTGISKVIQEENFDNFDLSLFRKSKQESEPISPYENMKDLREELQAYSKNFDKDSVNLYLFGEVGTGKTYLLNAITKEVVDQNHSVVYLTESDLINTLLEYRFAYSESKDNLKDKIDPIYNSDLLIIDDLGTYNSNEVTKSALFEILNSRLVHKKPVVISSNLNAEELRERFDSRIHSRIIGNYYQKRVFGSDLRMRL